jgi:hypothetical protein
MASILLIPLAKIRILQEIQHRSCQSFILEKIHHLEPSPAFRPPLSSLPSLSRDPLNPPLEGEALSLPCSASAKQMPTRLFSSRVTPPASIQLFFLYPHKVGPNEGMAGGQLEEDRRRALWDFLEGRPDARPTWNWASKSGYSSACPGSIPW